MHVSFQYMIDIQIYSNPILAEIEFDTHEMGHLDLDEEVSKVHIGKCYYTRTVIHHRL